jgi:hypothetical protein
MITSDTWRLEDVESGEEWKAEVKAEYGEMF